MTLVKILSFSWHNITLLVVKVSHKKINYSICKSKKNLFIVTYPAATINLTSENRCLRNAICRLLKGTDISLGTLFTSAPTCIRNSAVLYFPVNSALVRAVPINGLHMFRSTP